MTLIPEPNPNLNQFVDNLTLDDVKQHLYIDTNLDDLYLNTLIEVSASYCENLLGYPCYETSSTIEFSGDYELEFGDGAVFKSSFHPDIIYVSGLTQSGTFQAKLYSNEVIIDENTVGFIITVPIQVLSFVTDKDESDLKIEEIEIVSKPKDAKKEKLINQARLLMIGDWFRNREDTTGFNLKKIPNAVESLLIPISKFY